ncbi:hypothetical protein PP707_07700, partial [Acetobacter pasteurianus]|nr:hypothetical protein [Acetobacter pasteurianus]
KKVKQDQQSLLKDTYYQAYIIHLKENFKEIILQTKCSSDQIEISGQCSWKICFKRLINEF